MSEYAVVSNNIRGLDRDQYDALREMCAYSNNLYNVTLYNIRQYFFEEKKFLTYESNYHITKGNENYGLLSAGIAQQTMRVVDRNFKSFFNLLKKCKQGKYRYRDVKIPRYRKKGDLFNLVLSTNAITIKNGYIQIPMSHKFKSLHPNTNPIRIAFPKHLEDKNIKEVRVLPYQNGKHFRIQYVYEVECENLNLNTDNVLGIDLGIENLAACVSNVGTSFIVDGRKLKSINQHWNKQNAIYKSKATKQGLRTTHRLQAMTDKRNRKVNDYMKKAARYIINYCISHNIGMLVVGYNPTVKDGVNMGKVNDQNFVQIPYGNLRQQLGFLCRKYGIEYNEVEESYTSKSSFIDKDFLPEYRLEQHYQGKFSGKRIHRGLYKTKEGILVNADINGAANIIRKCKQDFDYEGLCTGVLATPQRIVVV